MFHQQPLSQRIDQLQSQARQWGLNLADDEYLVTLDLQSPLLLNDGLMQPRFEVHGDDLAVHGPDLSWQVLPYQVHLHEVGGWLALINRPAPRRVGLAPGCVIPVRVRGERQGVLDACASLQNNGLGEAWGAGFGHLIINHPFHINTTGGGR